METIILYLGLLFFNALFLLKKREGNPYIWVLSFFSWSSVDFGLILFPSILIGALGLLSWWEGSPLFLVIKREFKRRWARSDRLPQVIIATVIELQHPRGSLFSWLYSHETLPSKHQLVDLDRRYFWPFPWSELILVVLSFMRMWAVFAYVAYTTERLGTPIMGPYASKWNCHIPLALFAIIKLRLVKFFVFFLRKDKMLVIKN